MSDHNDPAAEQLPRYEGLIYTTALRYVGFVGEDLEDIQQMLRLKAWQALQKYDPQRSAMSQDTYVFSCLKNRCKDMVKKLHSIAGQARSQELFIEDIAPRDTELPLRDKFEQRYLSSTHEETYADVECEELVLPSTLTGVERNLVALLYLDFKRPEVAELLGISRGEVEAVLRTIQEKMADWKPSADGTVVVLRPAALSDVSEPDVRRAA